jgi:2-polyprenyl-3-methyl-5-hydroxy-6-metoxy-1,4-benzoquinol methylase
MTNSLYFIDSNYEHREYAEQSKREVDLKDECQDPVYRVAYGVLDDNGLMSVLDVGCGGAFKLLKYFNDLDYNLVMGMDTPPTYDWLMKKYPNRQWMKSVLNQRSRWDEMRDATWDLVICADVIEHLPDPDVLLDFIQHIRPRYFVLSTPNRTQLQEMFLMGPPRNTAHYREWTFEEFHSYIESRFVIEEHCMPEPGDCTQVVIGHLR